MLTLRLIRRFCTIPHSIATEINRSVKKPIEINEPALINLKNERDPEKLFNLFKANAHNRLVVENRFAFEDTVSRLAGAGRFDYIENLLEHQKTLPQGRREGFIIRLIMLYGRAGMIKHAVNTFCDMHLYGCNRTVKSFNAALKVLTQSRDLESINSFLNDIPFRFGIKLDVYSVNIVIKAFCEMGFLDKAIIVMVEMEKLGIKPDVITYTTLISAFYKANRAEIANGLWNSMVLKGCAPNIATFNVRIQFLVCKGRAWEANKLLAYMRRRKKLPDFFPDEVTYNLVIKGFCRAGFYDMAMRVYSAFHDEGFKPNQKIYQTMIHYLCAAGKFDLAYTMCKDSMQKNWFPSVDTINNLLEGLRKEGKVDKAVYIYGLAMKRKPRFSASQVEIMKSILSRN
ncbi:pentatricopeptide repeat-containing protein at1g80150 mitochondrial [Phtheirospermum japonicum]|uniref:Pentatricopeptide repeat-containing protein at1g80150 mitochondrial n=1 Tax=Phtheirospermum japonicum TaxID=374723 RepID=A0A830DN46_9LAMI|nr:pentatricopeptide repeat-containing protein at1g80150 mitochondrial [Phtheirospermum japonicum]